MHHLSLHRCIIIPGGLLLARHFHAFLAKSDTNLLVFSGITGIRFDEQLRCGGYYGALWHLGDAPADVLSCGLTEG